MKQTFQIEVLLVTEVVSGDKPYLNALKVRKQLEKVFRDCDITKGLPCHGVGRFYIKKLKESVP